MEPAKKEEEKIDSKESSNSKTSKESKLEGVLFPNYMFRRDRWPHFRWWLRLKWKKRHKEVRTCGGGRKSNEQSLRLIIGR